MREYTHFEVIDVYNGKTGGLLCTATLFSLVFLENSYRSSLIKRVVSNPPLLDSSPPRKTTLDETRCCGWSKNGAPECLG
jgi:hypothetical protein